MASGRGDGDGNGDGNEDRNSDWIGLSTNEGIVCISTQVTARKVYIYATFNFLSSIPT